MLCLKENIKVFLNRKVLAEKRDNKFLDYGTIFKFDLTKKACLSDLPAIQEALKTAWCKRKFPGSG